MKEFEFNPDYSDEVSPSPLTQYFVTAEYLKEICDLILIKIRENDPFFVPEIE